jgi:hypothetical protein
MTTEIVKKVNEYTIRKVKRNFEGSYAIFKNEVKSVTQYNAGTVAYFIKMTDIDFLNYIYL